MNNELGNWLRSFASLNRSEQRGIVVLVILIAIISGINFIMPKIIKPDISDRFSYNVELVEKFIAKQRQLTDSIERLNNSQKISSSSIGDSLFTFDPNLIDDSLLKILGFSESQIINVRNYQNKGGKFRKKEDLKKLYLISDTEYDIIKPYIKIKEPSIKQNTQKLNEVNINLADSALLVSNLKLSPYMASRIVKYRNLLGGYYHEEQLMEVYGFTSTMFNNVRDNIMVDTNTLKKMELNSVTFKNMLRHPYFDYETTKIIMDFRYKNGDFSCVKDLLELGLVSDSVYSKQKYYLYIRAQ